MRAIQARTSNLPGMHRGIRLRRRNEFWLSQIPAANGQLWHSLTGFDAVITDKRLLRVLKKVTRAKRRPDRPVQPSANASNGASSSLIIRRLSTPTMSGMTTLLFRPFILQAVHEKTYAIKALAGLMGIRPEACTGHDISAAYGVLEPEGEALNQALTETKYIPVKGELLYVSAEKEAKKLMTLIPPFAPPDGVGAPPERAGLPVTHTGIPLLLENRVGKGRVLTGFFELSRLMLEIGLEDQKQLFGNCISYLNGEETEFDGALLPEGIFAYPYRAGEKFLVHLVNGVGSRPLKNTVEPSSGVCSQGLEGGEGIPCFFRTGGRACFLGGK